MGCPSDGPGGTRKVDHMGTTINLHVHDGETVTVEHYSETHWPRIVVKDEYGGPVSDVSLLFPPAVVAALGAALLDNDTFADALTPAQLAQLARTVRDKAPGWILQEAGLTKGDPTDDGIRRAGAYDIELAGTCDHCGAAAGWVTTPGLYCGEAIHRHGLFSCIAQGVNHACTIRGACHRGALPILSDAEGADDLGQG